MSSQPYPSAVPASVAVAAGTTAADALAAAGVPLTGPSGAVVVRDLATDALKDLDWVPDEDARVEPVALDSGDGRAVLRHSTAHVMAQAVQDLFPGTRLGIGPPIENGFYYDFLPERPFTPEDLDRIEKRMQEIVKAGQRFSRRPVSDDEARAELADEPFKLELIGLKGAAEDTEGASAEVGAGQLTMYDNLDRDGERVWTDLCRGPHLPTTRLIPAFKLMRSAAAYWRGSEKNPQLQRIYGTAWETRDALKEHLRLLAEAEKRDHRRLGAELDLFSFPDELGSGLPVFHPKGGIIRREMEDYSRRRHIAAGYEFVNTPHITKGHLFEVSGHLDWYADGMFPPMQLEGAQYYLKPMNCPMHDLIFRARGRSYRELPLRMFEFGTVYRYEKSGVVHGLTRVRGMTQDDAHIFCTREQVADELRSLLTFVLDLLADYGLDDFYLELSTRNPEKSIGVGRGLGGGDRDPARRWPRSPGWSSCPTRAAPRSTGRRSPCRPGTRSAAPGRCRPSSWTSTLPERFELEYQAADGSRQRPVMIHRALFGSIERFFGVLTEHYAGAFPAWLSPVQAVGIPVADAHVPLPGGVRGPAAGRGRPGRGGRLRRPDAEEDPHRHQAKVPFLLHRRRRGRRRRRRVVPVPRRLAAQRRAAGQAADEIWRRSAGG